MKNLLLMTLLAWSTMAFSQGGGPTAVPQKAKTIFLHNPQPDINEAGPESAGPVFENDFSARLHHQQEMMITPPVTLVQMQLKCIMWLETGFILLT